MEPIGQCTWPNPQNSGDPLTYLDLYDKYGMAPHSYSGSHFSNHSLSASTARTQTLPSAPARRCWKYRVNLLCARHPVRIVRALGIRHIDRERIARSGVAWLSIWSGHDADRHRGHRVPRNRSRTQAAGGSGEAAQLGLSVLLPRVRVIIGNCRANGTTSAIMIAPATHGASCPMFA